MAALYAQPHLERVIAGKESTPFMLLLESPEQSAFPFLVQAVRASVNRRVPTLVIAADYAPSLWTRSIPAAEVEDVREETVGATTFQSLILARVQRFLARHRGAACTIAIDSLTPLGHVLPTPTDLARGLRDLLALLSASSSVLVAIAPASNANGGGKSLQAQGRLEQVATTTVRVENGTRADRERHVVADRAASDLILSVEANATNRLVARVHARRAGGKVVHEAVEVVWSGATVRYTHFDEDPALVDPAPVAAVPTPDNGDKKETDAAVHVHEKRASAPASSSSDPTAGLSFNLRLSDKQREAKAQVVLPYLSAQQPLPSTSSGSGSNSSGGGGGIVSYEYDVDDDFDDDDPDADLEF
ncbi:Elongator complex protein 5 [Blastocladiella britannica]|nr:Elongator complex protein 5 [Blastocladiella britannica]